MGGLIMAQRKGNGVVKYDNKRKSEAYVRGNTVRKLHIAEPFSNEPMSPEEYVEKRKRRTAQEKKIRRANRMNFLYTVAVLGVVALMFTICYQYLNMQASVKNSASEIAQLEQQLAKIKSSNDEEEQEINASIDYDAIYNTAVNELGMIYPERNQVITYDAGVSEYVKQYQDIPEQDK